MLSGEILQTVYGQVDRFLQHGSLNLLGENAYAPIVASGELRSRSPCVLISISSTANPG